MFEAKIIIPGLEELAAAINNLAGVKPVAAKKVAKKEEKVIEEAGKVNEGHQSISEDTEEELPKGDGEIVYTLEQVRAKMIELSRAGKAKDVKEILTSLGASNLSGLDPSKYAEAMEKAGAL